MEVNNNSKNYIVKRNLLYFFRLIGMCLKEAENYKDIEMHTQINLTWGLQKYYNYDITDRDKIELCIMDSKTHITRYGDVFKIIDVNMDYFNRLCYNENMKEEEKLLKFLSSKNKEELAVNSEGDAFMEEIKKDVERLNVSEKTLDELYVEGEEQRVRNTERRIGSEEKSIEIAKNMISKNLDTKMISEITGLSEKQIEELK